MIDKHDLLERAQAVAQAGAQPLVPSPCQSVCRMDASLGLCVGCYRSLAEIAQWSQASAQRKQQIWAAIQSRVGSSSTS